MGCELVDGNDTWTGEVPTEPDSKIIGMPTEADPTDMSITTSRPRLAAAWVGYGLMPTGIAIAGLIESIAAAEPDEPPQTVKSAANSREMRGRR
jgi:hypothetical protein